MDQMMVVDVQLIISSTCLIDLDQSLHSVVVTMPTGGLSTLNDLQVTNYMLIKWADNAEMIS